MINLEGYCGQRYVPRNMELSLIIWFHFATGDKVTLSKNNSNSLLKHK